MTIFNDINYIDSFYKVPYGGIFIYKSTQYMKCKTGNTKKGIGVDRYGNLVEILYEEKVEIIGNYLAPSKHLFDIEPGTGFILGSSFYIRLIGENSDKKLMCARLVDGAVSYFDGMTLVDYVYNEIHIK